MRINLGRIYIVKSNAETGIKMKRNEREELHGGDIYRNRIICDFSVNISPLGLPEGVKEVLRNQADAFTAYPDLYCERLRAAIGKKQGIHPAHIFCGNGASEVLQLVLAAIGAKRLVLASPCFSGYERAMEAVFSGRIKGNGKNCPTENINYVNLKEEEGYKLTEEILAQIKGKSEVIILCNPNNPVGNCIRQELLLKIMERCRERESYLVLDECFLEFLPDYERRSLKGYVAENPELIVVNAFTKLYAMPGFRLGYAMLSDKALYERMRKLQPEWSVSTVAQLAGEAALQDENYVNQVRKIVETERFYLREKLEEMDYIIYKSDGNFLLLRGEEGLKSKLLDKGILIRSCENFRGLTKYHYRVAVKTRRENDILLKALREIKAEG